MSTHSDTDITHWLAWYGALGYSEHTLRAYRSDARAWAAYLRGHGRSLRTATFANACSYLTWRASEGDAPKTVKRRMATMKGLHAWLYSSERSTSDVCRALKQPRVKVRVARRTHTPAEIDQLKAAARCPADRLWIALLYDCQLRIEEVARLQVSNIDFERMRFTFIGKGGDQEQIVIREAAWTPLVDYLAHRGPRRGDYLFPARARNRPGPAHVSTHTIRRRVYGVAAAAQLTGRYNPHSLRADRAEHDRSAGVDIAWTNRNMRHRSYSMTMHYMNPPTEEPVVQR